jgi:hypothetical protein
MSKIIHPTIEEIVDGMKTGAYSREQGLNWLYQHVQMNDERFQIVVALLREWTKQWGVTRNCVELERRTTFLLAGLEHWHQLEEDLMRAITMAHEARERVLFNILTTANKEAKT